MDVPDSNGQLRVGHILNQGGTFHLCFKGIGTDQVTPQHRIGNPCTVDTGIYMAEVVVLELEEEGSHNQADGDHELKPDKEGTKSFSRGRHPEGALFEDQCGREFGGVVGRVKSRKEPDRQRYPQTSEEQCTMVRKGDTAVNEFSEGGVPQKEYPEQRRAISQQGNADGFCHQRGPQQRHGCPKNLLGVDGFDAERSERGGKIHKIDCRNADDQQRHGQQQMGRCPPTVYGEHVRFQGACIEIDVGQRSEAQFRIAVGPPHFGLQVKPIPLGQDSRNIGSRTQHNVHIVVELAPIFLLPLPLGLRDINDIADLRVFGKIPIDRPHLIVLRLPTSGQRNPVPHHADFRTEEFAGERCR